MSVEAPSVSIAPIAGPTFSGGATFGSGFNPAEFSPISSINPIINEGPVAPGFFENAVPFSEKVSSSIETSIPSVFLDSFAESVNTLKPLPDVIPEPVLSQGEQVIDSEAISLIAQTRRVGIQDRLGMTMEDYNVTSKVFTATTAELSEIAPYPVQGTERAQLEAVRARLASMISEQTKIISTPGLKTKAIEQAEEEKKIDVQNEVVEERSDLRESEDVEIFEVKIVEAEEVSKVRDVEIGEAGQKAYDEVKEEAKDLGVEVEGIDGRRMEKYLTENSENISPIRRGKGGDGSLDQTIWEITSRFFKSVSDIKDAAKLIIPNNRPAKYAKEGNVLDDQEVAKVEKRNIFNPVKSK